MRKVYGLLAAAVFVLGAAAPAGAASITGGVLSVAIGALPPITIAQSPAAITGVTVTSGGGFSQAGGTFAATVILPTALFTGVPLISSLNVNSAANGSGTFTPAGGGGGGLGGSAPLAGTAVVGVLGGLVNLNVPLAGAGGGGQISVAAASLAVSVTGNLWTTGSVVLTKITTTPDGATAPVNTVTYSGSDARTATNLSSGQIMLVAPLRILTNAAGNLPGLVTQTLTFVPEPGAALLFTSVAAGLCVLGRVKGKR